MQAHSLHVLHVDVSQCVCARALRILVCARRLTQKITLAINRWELDLFYIDCNFSSIEFLL